MARLFLDTNILARFLLGDILDQQREVLEIFRKAKNGDLTLCVYPEVFIELNYVLSKTYQLQKLDIIEGFKVILQFSFIECQNSDIFFESLEMYKSNNISLEDSYFISICLTKNWDFYSFDQKALKVFQKAKN